MAPDSDKKVLGAYDDYRWMAKDIQKEASRHYSPWLLIPAALFVGCGLCLLTGGSYKTIVWLGFLATASCFIIVIPISILTNRRIKENAADLARRNPGFGEFFKLYQKHYWKDTLTGDRYDRFTALLATPVDKPVWTGETGTRPWGTVMGEARRPPAPASPLRAGGPVLAGSEPVQAAGIPPPAPELTADERQVLDLMAEGKQFGEIAAHMGISDDQTSLIISRLVKTFRVFGAAGLVEQARQRGYLPPVEAALPAAEPAPPDEEAPLSAAKVALLAEQPLPAGEEPLMAAAEVAPLAEQPLPAGEEPLMAAAERGRGRWHPLLITLLNLTGLGIGYLFLKRPLRWLFHAAVTAGLLVAAWYTNAARHPLPWLIGLGAWLAWMAVDGWLAARRQEWATHRPWLPAAAAVALIGLEAAGLWLYNDLCTREFLLGMIDYQQGSCAAAMDRLGTVGSACELTFSSNVPVAETKCAECNLLRGAVDARQAGRFDEAVTGYQAYLVVYPGGDLAAHARDNAAAVYGEWAGALRSGADYQAAIDKYEQGRSAYPGTAAAEQAPALAAETYAEWAAQLRQEGQFDQAIAKYETILAAYPATEAGAEAAEQAAGAYADWAARLREEGEYEAAIAKYEAILAAYPATEAGAEAAEQAAGAYADWAARLREEDEYETAIAKYEAILAAYPATEAGAEAPFLAAETHGDWAAQQRQEGDYEAAVANYQAIVDRYPNTPPAARAPEQAAATYNDWAGQLRGRADYTLAAEKYQVVLDRYPTSGLAPTARESLAGTLYDWAEVLRAGRDYPAAVERYQTILSDFSTSQVISQSVEGLAWTTYDWAASLQAQGQYGQAIDRYEQILADPRLSAVVTTTINAALETRLAWAAELVASQKWQETAAQYQVVAETAAKGSKPAADALAGLEAMAAQAEGLATEKPCDAVPILDALAGTTSAARAAAALPGALLGCGHVLREADQLDKAEASYLRVPAEFPRSKQAAAAGRGVKRITWIKTIDSRGLDAAAAAVCEKAGPGVQAKVSTLDRPWVAYLPTDTWGGISLPDSLTGERRQTTVVACVGEEQESQVEVCTRYMAEGQHEGEKLLIYRMRKYRRVRLVDPVAGLTVAAGTIYGSAPKICPQSGTIYFFVWTGREYYYGDSPDQDDLAAWINKNLK